MSTQLPLVHQARGGSGTSMEALRALINAHPGLSPSGGSGSQSHPPALGGDGIETSRVSSTGSVSDAVLFVWQSGSGARAPTDWQQLAGAGAGGMCVGQSSALVDPEGVVWGAVISTGGG